MITYSGSIHWGDKTTELEREYHLNGGDGTGGMQTKQQTRIFIYELLCRHLEKNFNQYGILTGVRPVKLVHAFLDQGLEGSMILSKLADEYRLSHDKASLLLRVAMANRIFLPAPAHALDRISVYVGIPFCPTRCSYCSFPGAVIQDYARDVLPFVDALVIELVGMGEYVRRRSWKIENIYIGGGTPTVLEEAEWYRIMNILQDYYISSATTEFTVEAGRPDTMSPAGMNFMSQAGVTRICINPQSMHDETLRRIGRHHSQKMVVDAVGWARQAKIKHLNMDLIVGLPGEGRGHYLSTAKKILDLRPDNLTVHTLARKRGSVMSAKTGWVTTTRETGSVEQGLKDYRHIFEENGYRPYYLYRQKYMLGGQENIGYALEGQACIYNIQMMEERQTIIGLGGGASSKIVDRENGCLINLHNPKDPRSYIKSVHQQIARKVDKLEGLN